MEKDILETMLIEYIDGRLNKTERETIEQALVNDPETYKLYEQLREVMVAMDKSTSFQPSDSLKTSFAHALKKEIRTTQGKTAFFGSTVYRVAAAVALLVAGVTGGYFVSQYQRQQEEIAIIKKQMDETKLMMMSMIDNPQSASQRLQGVNVALTIDKADDEVVKALVKAMNEDANTNVRLAALDALSKFYREPAVRSALIHSMEKQKDPMVQIALIQLLVKLREKTVVKQLERIIDDAGNIKAVKDEAYTGIIKLS